MFFSLYENKHSVFKGLAVHRGRVSITLKANLGKCTNWYNLGWFVWSVQGKDSSGSILH